MLEIKGNWVKFDILMGKLKGQVIKLVVFGSTPKH